MRRLEKDMRVDLKGEIRKNSRDKDKMKNKKEFEESGVK